MSFICVNVKMQRKIKHARFKITEMGFIDNGEEHRLATSCDYGKTILLTKLFDAFFRSARFVK